MMQAFLEKRDDQVFMTRGKGYAFPLHLHPHFELIMVHRGSMRITVENQIELVEEGGLALVFPNQVHSYESPSDDNWMTAFVISLSLLKEYAGTLLRYRPVRSFVEKAGVHENIEYAMDQMYREFRQVKPNRLFAPFVHLILARLLDGLSLTANPAPDYQNLLWRISDYVSRHYCDPVSLEGMAQTLGISKYRLSRVFTERIGMSLPSYLNSIRLTHACSLLENSDYSIVDISEESGFGCLRSFLRVFKAAHQMTPLEYRKSRNIGIIRPPTAKP